MNLHNACNGNKRGARRKRYFTSDQHFFDGDIISYTDRPYSTPQEMNSDMIERFLSKTHDATEIYILGDMLGSGQPSNPYNACGEILEKLKIHEKPFHLIRGNHDTLSNEEYLELGFSTVKKIDFIEIGGLKVMITHDPCMVQPRNLLAVCGHIHTLFYENWQPDRMTLTINVSVEMRNYEPVSEDEILGIAARSPYSKFLPGPPA